MTTFCSFIPKLSKSSCLKRHVLISDFRCLISARTNNANAYLQIMRQNNQSLELLLHLLRFIKKQHKERYQQLYGRKTRKSIDNDMDRLNAKLVFKTKTYKFKVELELQWTSHSHFSFSSLMDLSKTIL